MLVGILLSNRKSSQFPYGLYKVENLVSLVSAFAIFFAGYEIGREVLLGQMPQMESLTIPLIVTGITLATTFLFSRYEMKKGKQVNSPGLIADAEHVMTDFYSSLVVVVGIVAQYFHLMWLLKLVVLVIIGFIFHIGFHILKEAIKVLLDASVDSETIEQVKKILQEHSQVARINSILGRNSGSYKFIEMDIALSIDSLEEAHEFVEHLKKHILDDVEFVKDVVIHFEPAPSIPKIGVLTNEQDKITSHFGGASKIHVFTKTDQGYQHQVLPNPAQNIEHGKSIELAEFLHKQGIRCIIMRTSSNQRPIKALDAFHIKHYFTDETELDKLNLDQFNC
jgi:cation diffusion facilitator family transporter